MGSPKILVVTVSDKLPTGVIVVTVLEKPVTVFITMLMITFVPLVNVLMCMVGRVRKCQGL